jgi:hypothetical protein
MPSLTSDRNKPATPIFPPGIRCVLSPDQRAKITTENSPTQTMKHIITSLKTLIALAALTLAVGCASTQSTENSLVAAGFKVITPSTPKQVAKLKALPANKVTLVRKDGKTYYVFPDVANNQAYVGGPKQFQTYQKNRQAAQIANDNLMAAEMNQEAAQEMEWGAWGGWGGWALGWY